MLNQPYVKVEDGEILVVHETPCEDCNGTGIMEIQEPVWNQSKMMTIVENVASECWYCQDGLNIDEDCECAECIELCKLHDLA